MSGNVGWLEVCIKTEAGGADRMAELLAARGVSGVVIEDEEDFRRFLDQNRRCWDYVDEELDRAMHGIAQVKFYVADSEDGAREWRAATGGLPGEVTVTRLENEDWGTAYQRYYRPIEVGTRLYIVPAWLDNPPPHGRVALRLNPGLTFGTGSHATTRLCMEALERHIKPGDAVLDLGCGSGILSIAALLLGARETVAVDIDPNAETVAMENAALNGFDAERYTVLTGDVLAESDLARRLGERKWPVILANIVADVILALAPRVRPWLAEGGVFLCSGILDTRADEVRDGLLAAGFQISEETAQEGWAAITAHQG